MKHVLAIAGSLRAGSYNRLLLRAAAAGAPADLSVEVYEELETVPMFSEDLEPEDPAGARALRERAAAADGLLISTPEYNWSIPGVLKNAIDWLSRREEVLARKPVAIIGASAGRWGTRLAQAALRQTLTATECVVMPAPALFVSNAAAIFDERGVLIDASVSKQLNDVLAAFEAWIVRR